MGEPPNPIPPSERIHGALRALSRRERALWVVRAGAAVVAGSGLSLLVAAGLLSIGAPREGALLGGLVPLVVGLGVCGWIGLGGPWRRAGAPVAQARLLESFVPALRGALLAAVAHPGAGEEGAKPAPRGVSEVLLQRAARRAADAIAAVPPAAIHPPRPARIAVAGAAAVVLGLWVADRTLPVGPFDAIAVATGRSVAEARMERAAGPISDERAVVGDIVLRYIYPDYTGIEPLEVPNSDGTIHAPPGTVVQITARTADPFDAAALQVDEGAAVDASLVGGRDITTSLTVEGAGTWRLVLFSGSERVLSPDYAIEVEDDAAPVVALEGTPPPAVARDRTLSIGWSVQDDFGVERVVLEVTRADGTVEEHALRTPLDAPRQLSGGVPVSPRQLGIPAGETVKMRVVAYDNDHLEGSKRGESPEVEMKVVGPRGQGRMLTAHYRRLRDALLPSLAAFLTDPMLPAASPRGMTAWVGKARERLTPARELHEAQWQGAAPSGLDAVLYGDVMDSSAKLFRFALTTWEAGSNRRVTPGDEEAFADLHAEAIEAQERAIYTLDSMLRQAALGELAQSMADLAQQAQQMAAMAENAEAGELLARLDQLERMMRSLQQAAEQLSEGQLQEFVNRGVDETRNLMEEIRQAITEGRLEDAREMMQQLAESVQQMSESLNSQMSSQQQGEDELGQQYEQTMEDLDQLEQDQQELADRMQQAREDMGDGVQELMELWKRLDELAAGTRDRSGSIVAGVGDGLGWRVDSLRWFEKLDQRAAGIQDGIRARDAASALERVTARQTLQALGMSTRLLENERDRRRPPSEPTPAGIGGALEAVSDIARNLEEMAELLEQLKDKQQQESPEVQQAAQQLADEQSQLEERGEQIADDVKRIERAMPTADGSASDAMEAADRAMERATEALEEGDAMSGEGHQRDATQRIGEARDALQREMQQYQQMQQQTQQMQGQQQGGQGNEGGEDQDRQARDRPFEIPAPEAFETPEQYRRQLLEGMEGDVPDEFEALKRRYYEELVRQ